MKSLTFLSAILFAATGLAAPPTAKPAQKPATVETKQALTAPATGATTSTATVAATAPANLIGVIDLRPSMGLEKVTGVNERKYHTENSVELGLKVNPNTSVSYVQEFNTNLYDPTPGQGGLGLQAIGGFVRGRFNNLWADKDSGLSFHYSPRVYLPTHAASRDAGMVTLIRNYLVLSKEVSKTLTLSAMEIPIFHLYSKAGSGTRANPIFENRVYLVADIALLDGRLNVSVPLMLNSTRFRNFGIGATNNNTWGHFVWTYPEVLYSVTPNTALGIAYYSDALMKEDLSGFTIGDGLGKGIAQLVLRASL